MMAGDANCPFSNNTYVRLFRLITCCRFRFFAFLSYMVASASASGLSSLERRYRMQAQKAGCFVDRPG
jgi:hypothetical protein